MYDISNKIKMVDRVLLCVGDVGPKGYTKLLPLIKKNTINNINLLIIKRHFFTHYLQSLDHMTRCIGRVHKMN